MHKVKKQLDSKVLCDVVVEGMQENKAEDITVLDLRKVRNAVCDFFIICTGNSPTQVEGISDSVVRQTRKILKEKPWHTEGKGNSEWILMDYVNVVAHVFYRETRAFYQLEDLWADAQRIDIKN